MKTRAFDVNAQKSHKPDTTPSIKQCESCRRSFNVWNCRMCAWRVGSKCRKCHDRDTHGIRR